ncbi:MAG: hypothetical protein JSV37_06715 [Anaerolineaceae bacterium]|nr:MAG: hypothetical protein JSV37_06715 [Anaerolineaceae bacterium]
MRNRIPSYFQLERFDIQPEDIVRLGLGCDPRDIQPTVILMPVWNVEIFKDQVDNVSVIADRRVYQLEYQGSGVSVIRSGIGAPLAGDVVLALGCTPCEKLIFAGSAGGLEKSMKIGDLMIAHKSLSGDGFSRYLTSEVVPTDRYLQPSEPDATLTEIVECVAKKHCHHAAIQLHRGTIISVDSIIGQFLRLEEYVKHYGCMGIEMETAAVFGAAKVVGIRACALLQVSDVIPAHKTLFSGRTDEDHKRRRRIKKEVLTKVLLESI